MKRFVSVSLCLLLLFVALPFTTSIGLTEEQQIDSIRLFEQKKVSFTVTNQGETLIPLDYSGVALNHVQCKSSGDKRFLFYLDYDGIHIIPVSKGKATITVTNTESKKDKMIFEIIIDEKAVADASAPLTCYMVFEHSFVRTDGELVAKYYISGGKGPYQCQYYTYDTRGNGSSGAGPESFTAKSSVGKIKMRVYSKLIFGRMMIVDAEGKTCTATSNLVTVLDELQVVPEYAVFLMPIGKTTEIPYSITGGSGHYSGYVSWHLEKDGFNVQEEVKQLKKAGTKESIKINPLSEGFIGYSAEFEDKKAKLHGGFYGPFVNIKEKGLIKLYVDQTVVKTGETITAHVELQDCSFNCIESIPGLLSYFDGTTFESVELKGTIIQTDPNHYDVSFTPKRCGVVIVYIIQKGFLISESGITVMVTP